MAKDDDSTDPGNKTHPGARPPPANVTPEAAHLQMAEALSSLAELTRSHTPEVRAALAARKAAFEAAKERDTRRAELYDGAKALIGTRYFGMSMLILAVTIAIVALSLLGLDVESLTESGVDAYRAYQGCPTRDAPLVTPPLSPDLELLQPIP